ncbi:phage portal protein [Afifella sp. IM 167]|uniref:phage portal protein n=1 Tax=Afifella sp. IM 167 TaxID=2033586 RepID=UPI001CCE1E75|nr:phage portal protein [Afifella sp. IM 167]MBZ8133238.1 capsid protein [Afifella sp. IM 167]
MAEAVAVKPGIIGRLLGGRGRGLPGNTGRTAPQASYLKDTRSGIIASRPAVLRESRDEIRRAWPRSAAIALDILHNSGRLSGAVTQVIGDTVGDGLTLSPRPSLSRLGYDEKETRDFISLVKQAWKHWAYEARECDLRGKFTVPQLVDISLRWDMAYGETTGVLDYLPQAARERYGITTGTKICLVPPTKLVQDTIETEGLYQGVFHDANGRPVRYRFSEKNGLISRKVDFPAKDRDGRHVVIHLFDPVDATDVRGISKLAPAFRKHLQHEVLEDATLQQAILQNIFAIVLTSKEPSKDAFEALEVLKDSQMEGASEIIDGFTSYFAAALERASEAKVHVNGEPQVSHLAPGEELDLKKVGSPNDTYLPFSASLSRDMARAIGITYGGLTMDHSDATYSSVRMEMASIWPVVLRRRERIAAPLNQMIFENWLDEEIGSGRIPLKGGYEAFVANRGAVTWAEWQGPPAPSADDYKSARASSERLENGTSAIEIECAAGGVDPEELFEMRVRTHRRYQEEGMRSPYEARTTSTRTDPDGGTPASQVN